VTRKPVRSEDVSNDMQVLKSSYEELAKKLAIQTNYAANLATRNEQLERKTSRLKRERATDREIYRESIATLKLALLALSRR